MTLAWWFYMECKKEVNVLMMGIVGVVSGLALALVFTFVLDLDWYAIFITGAVLLFFSFCWLNSLRMQAKGLNYHVTPDDHLVGGLLCWVDLIMVWFYCLCSCKGCPLASKDNEAENNA